MEIISGFVDFFGNNLKVVAVGIAIAGAMFGVVRWLLRLLQDKRDRDKICRFLRRSAKERGWAFRTTHAISSATKLPENRVSELCRRDKRIKRNDKEKESWRLI